MQSFLKQKIKSKIGIVKSPEKDILGTHQGIQFYTIGQKALPSLGIQIDKPKDQSDKRFYIAKKIKPNTLIVAPEGHSSLKRKAIIIKNIHLINPNKRIPSSVKVRIRHLGQLISGKIIKKQNKFYFTFQKPQEAIAQGQYLVFYKGNEVLGSGEIRFK